MTSKPYFSNDVENKIVSVILAETSAAEKSIPESAVRDYVRAPKTIEENLILQGVSDGIYLAIVQEQDDKNLPPVIAYKVKSPNEDELQEIHNLAEEKALEARNSSYTSQVYPPVNRNKPAHARRIEAQRAQRENERKAAFERSKEAPSVDKIKETIINERGERLSHALNWTHKSPKLNASLTTKV